MTTIDTVAAVQETVRESAAAGTPTRIVGRGTWLAGGRPVRSAAAIDLRHLTGIVEYVPGDLTLTARAGTTLDEIARVTAAAGQWLTLDPWGGDAGTLGATVATATAGSLSHALGLARDNVIGVEFVTGAGEIVRGGGKVVKNVAGFDLTRLTVGAWGTLGIITELSVRLRARPEVDRTLAMALPASAGALGDLLERLRTAPLAALAMEMVNDALARRLGVGARSALLVRLGGNADVVRAQHATLSALGDVGDLPVDVWRTLREAEPDEASVVRYSDLPSRLGATWAHALDVGGRFPDALVHATVGRGVARCILPDLDAARVGDAVRSAQFDGTRVFERLPAPVWPTLAPGSVNDRLSRGVKRVFDPRNVLNPGILGESET